MNLAALWKLPVLFLCENNLYAMGTSIARHASNPELVQRAAPYGIPGRSVDGMDVLAVREAVRDAVAAIREGGGPRFLELRTYRFRAHSMYDAELYRDKDEVERWKQRDPLTLFTLELRSRKLASEEELAQLERDAVETVAEAVRVADEGPLEPVEDLMRHVHTREIVPGEILPGEILPPAPGGAA
jgi:pyruvate dehydrogenase E1 component alpha subunit